MCGQRSNRAAGSKRRALAFSFSTRALAAGLPHQNYVWITTDELLRSSFHKNEFNEMPFESGFH